MKHYGQDMEMVDRAYNRVVECQKRIRRQTVLVAAMAVRGHDTILVQRTLDAMTASLAVLEQHWTSEMQALRSRLSLPRALGQESFPCAPAGTKKAPVLAEPGPVSRTNHQ